MSLLTTCFIVLLLTCQSQAGDIGQFEQVINQVDHSRAGKIATAKPSDGLVVKDSVITKEQSRAKLGFVDETKMTVGPNTDMTIEEYMFEGDNPKHGMAKVYKGVVETVVPYSANNFVVETPTAIAGIRD